jgi:hypothetical protein
MSATAAAWLADFATRAGAPVFETGYKIDEVWSAESKERLRLDRI